MRPIAALIVVFCLAAGCGAGAAPSPGVTGTPATPGLTTTTPPSTSTPSATATDLAVGARVDFDGSDCVYSGPTVLTSPATLTVDYRPTPSQGASALVVFAIRSDTTAADIDRTDHDPNQAPIAAGPAPWWALGESFHAQFGFSTNTYQLQIVQVGKITYDRYFIDCATSEPFVPIPAEYTIVELVEV